MSVFGGHFLACGDCILKMTTVWWLKLFVLYSRSFMHIHNTAFQTKMVVNNVLFSARVHNPLHAQLSAQNCVCIYIYDWEKRCACEGLCTSVENKTLKTVFI